MLTLTDVLVRGAPGLVAVHVPDPDVQVRWVATSELADPTPFLEGGEMLLTTGLGTQEWREEWDPYVARLLDADVAVIGLGTGLTHGAVPEALLAACRRHNLALLEVPKDVTFVAVSRATAQMLEEQESQAERRAHSSQRSLVQAAVRHSDPHALLSVLAESVDGVACILDRDGTLMSGPTGANPRRLDLELVTREVARLRSRGGRAAATVADRRTTTEIQPLGLADRAEQYLAISVEGRMGTAQRATVTTAVALLGLAVENARQRRDTERALRARAIELAVGGDAASARIVLATVPDQPRLARRTQILRAVGDPETLQDGLALAEGAHALAAISGGELVVATEQRRASHLVTSLAAAGLRIGVGSLLDLTTASRSHAEAGHALAETTTSVPVVYWEHLVGQGALAMLERPRATAFATSYLEPLVAADLLRHDLVTTLRSFVRQHGSRAKMALELGVHRNTVRTRVQLIERELGASLDDPQTRATAWISLQLQGD